jgi:hypothetical protein
VPPAGGCGGVPSTIWNTASDWIRGDAEWQRHDARARSRYRRADVVDLETPPAGSQETVHGPLGPERDTSIRTLPAKQVLVHSKLWFDPVVQVSPPFGCRSCKRDSAIANVSAVWVKTLPSASTRRSRQFPDAGPVAPQFS